MSADWCFFQKKSASTSREKEFMLVLLLVLAKLSFETQVFPNIGSCFQTVIWCSVCAPTICRALIFIWIGSVCVRVCGRGTRGVKQCKGKWNELCPHRGVQICPQSYRSSTTIPPQGTKLLPYLHIDLCKVWNQVYIILFAYRSMECFILYNTAAKYCFENYSLSVLEMYPLFQQHNKIGVCSLSFDPLFFFPLSELLTSPAACKAWRSCIEIKTFKTHNTLWRFSCWTLTAA